MIKLLFFFLFWLVVDKVYMKKSTILKCNSLKRFGNCLSIFPFHKKLTILSRMCII